MIWNVEDCSIPKLRKLVAIMLTCFRQRTKVLDSKHPMGG